MINNVHFSQYLPPTIFSYVTGTWAMGAGQVADTISMKKSAADNTAIVTIPIAVPSNSVALQGVKIASIEIDWEVTALAMDAVTAAINKVTRGADTAVATVAAVPFTYDTGHDSAAKRLTLEQHRMTLTITTPFFLDNDDFLLVKLTMDAGATSVLEFYGAVVNYTFRA